MSWSVLVVDDEPMTRDLLRIMLSHADFEVFEAEDGINALTKIKSMKPDIVILDVMMPNMDGIAVCERIRADEETANLPVILLSAKTQPMAVEAGLQAGAQKYLTKPISRKVLLKNLREVLEGVTAA